MVSCEHGNKKGGMKTGACSGCVEAIPGKEERGHFGWLWRSLCDGDVMVGGGVWEREERGGRESCSGVGYTGMDMVPAALTNLPLWVMNVVPLNASDTSPVIFDRGLIGQCMGLMRYAHISVHWTEPVGIPEAATK
ncbi:probable methyltransferase PMT23 [Tanacetum coccineum]